MTKKKELINLGDIKCNQIVDKIKECTCIVEKFRCVLNKHLEYKELQEPQIYITRYEKETFKTDEKTKTPGYEYEIYWCLPYIKVDEKVDISKFNYTERYMWPNVLMFFKLNLTERIKDHSYSRGQYFELHITEELRKKIPDTKIAWYNDNYSLTSMLDKENIYLCIERINAVYKRIALKQILLDELCEVCDIQDINAYINKNCKV